MKKKLFAAFIAACILCSLCACGAQEAASNQETEQTTTAATTQPVEVPSYPVLMTYADYMKLTPAQQQAYYESFPDPETYMDWFNSAALAHNQGNSDATDKPQGNAGQITQPTEPPQQPTPEDPTEPTAPNQRPAEPDPNPTVGSQENKDPVLLTYEEYLKLTPAQQQAYYESFPSAEAYMQWFNQATADYDQSNNNSQEGTQPDGSNEETKPTEGGDVLDGYGSVGGRG